jgi:very-short-patch-repair endonuclease
MVGRMSDRAALVRTPAAPRSRATSRVDTTRPFRRADALAAGITRGELAGPAYRRLFTGVYVSVRVPPHPLQLVQAALLIHPPSAFASPASAARVYGVPLPAGLAEEHVGVFAAADRRRRRGIRHHVVRPDTPVATMRGLRVSSPRQCFVELAEQLGLVDLVVVGDHFVRKGWVTPEELVEHAAGAGGAPARRAAAYVRRDVDSPMETRLRMLIVLAGLPEPVVNHKVLHADGRVRYRFDLSWPEVRVAVEYDGRQHRDDLDQWEHDLVRDEWMDDATWKRVPVFSRGIYKRPDETLARVEKALRARGLPGLPARLGEDWRPHFPVVR